MKVGDQRQLTMKDFSVNGTVVEVNGIETERQKGILCSYTVEDYGITAPFFIPDGSVLSEHIDSRRGLSGMPREYVYKDGRHFDWTLYGEDVGLQKKIINSFVIRFDTFRKEGRGLYIQSKTKGSGKTLLACCIANEILKRNDISVKFISMIDYIELVKSKNEDAREKRNKLKECTLLIVDDIGAQIEDKEWIISSIFELVNRRYSDLLPTIYTSNLPIEELKCGERSTERIYDVSIPLIIPEKNIRRKKADEQNATFLRSVLGQEESQEKSIF